MRSPWPRSTGCVKAVRASAGSWSTLALGFGPFRQALTERGLIWAMSIPYTQKVDSADVATTSRFLVADDNARTMNLPPPTFCSGYPIVLSKLSAGCPLSLDYWNNVCH